MSRQQHGNLGPSRRLRWLPAPRAGRGGQGRLLVALPLVLCSWLGSCGEPPEAQPPNVVLISLDTLRADRLSCYGNPHRTSPAADRLAEEGVLFERALSTSSWTLPAHVSMLTGLPVSAHGVCHGNPATIADSLRGDFVSERLGRAGYATAGFCTCLWLEPRFGFGGASTPGSTPAAPPSAPGSCGDDGRRRPGSATRRRSGGSRPSPAS